MSMHNYANYGFVVPLSKLSELLTDSDKEELDNLLGDTDAETICVFLDEHLPAKMLHPVEVFQFNSDEMESEDLEEDWYAFFNEDQLFTKTPTDAFKQLQALNVEPKQSQWVTWG